MKNLCCFLILLCYCQAGWAQTSFCPNFNQPAPLADQCSGAPFLCGNYLDGYCSSNDSLGNDTIGAWTFAGGGFLRLSPCADSLVLGVQLSNCTDTFGLRVRLFGGNCDSLDLMTEYVAPADSAVELLFAGLVADKVYYLAFDSPDDAVCGFSLQVLAGMGTAVPGDTCNCTDGTIDGPMVLCPGQVATYSIIPPVCTIIPGNPIGGNGIYCPPPPEIACANADSLMLVWHIPDDLMFLGDSTGTTIQVLVDSALNSFDTLIQGLIWVEWKLVSTNPADTLSFCACSGCSGSILPKEVTIRNKIRYEFCSITCANPICVINNVPYFAPGNYVQQIQEGGTCVKVLVSIDLYIIQPWIDLGPDRTICAGESVVLEAQPVQPNQFYFWNTGETSPFLVVQPAVTTTYSVVVTDLFSGCTASDEITVIVTPNDTLHLGAVGTVSCTIPCFEFMGQNYCEAGIYSLQDSCTVTIFEIIFIKDTLNLGVADTITCTEPCVMVLNETYCEPGNYTISDSCHIYHFSILIDTMPITVGAPVHDCLPSNTQYTVSFSIQGQPPFKVNGNTITGAFYTSAPIVNGNPYSFVVEQAGNGCLQVIAGQYSCAFFCNSDAGAMSDTPIAGCAGQSFQVQPAAAAILSPGDTLEYILHTLAGDSIGVILARNATGLFYFDPTVMAPGETYFVSAVVGPPAPTGGVDLSHSCTQVAPGQAVLFYELWLDLGPDQTVHQGGAATLEASTNAGKIATISWLANDQLVQEAVLQWQAQPLFSTAYLCEIVDSNGCTANDSVLVQVNEGALYFPNVVYPGSGEQLNRYFTLFSTEGYIRRIQYLEIYSRWGELLFSKKDFQANQPQEGWDGQGAPLNVYIFRAGVELYDGKAEVLTGDVTVLR